MRHIHESHIIQSPTYAKLTNRQKKYLHAKLLHSTHAANSSYNKLANRSTVPDISFDHEPEPEPEVPPTPAKTTQGLRIAESASFTEI
ncbi:TPA: hypothetical protein N0F65_010210 [Lagenidium giganteum]|uniref:Uncharacterized protein n=1 Tax=Lagenidium giganteum TaxID=4803 RepID=A0AAV2Z0X9_9STRA|nr:TPA: hypothetical protein N0F65_010210 [Lagenidium giganteum]